VIAAYEWKLARTPRQRSNTNSTRQYDKLPPGVDIGTAIGIRNACFLRIAG
jgi:hypothetical protein